MKPPGDRDTTKPDIVSVMPGVLLFVALATHILVLLLAAAMLAYSLYKGSAATRRWTIIGVVAGAALGIAVWQPLHLNAVLH
jgi:hypothetical protein